MKQWPSKNLVCLQKGFVNSNGLIPIPSLCGRGFVMGPQLAAAAVGPGCCSSPRPSPRLVPWCCCRDQSPEHWGQPGGPSWGAVVARVLARGAESYWMWFTDNPTGSLFSAQVVLVGVTVMKYCPSKDLGWKTNKRNQTTKKPQTIIKYPY